MTDTLNDSDLRRYALLGAEARLLQIDEETASIYQAFPELRRRTGAERTLQRSPEAAPATGRGRRRGAMSAAQREAARERMKRYWAKRKGASAASDAPASGAGSATTATADTAAGAAKKVQASRTKTARGTRGPRKMSAAARKRISDAQKARWAKRRRANA